MAGMLLVVVGGAVAVWKVFPLLLELAKALTELAKQSKALLAVCDGIQRELAYIRALAPPPSPNSGVDVGSSQGFQQAAPPDTPPPFPSPIFDRFDVRKPEPDAKIEDTDSGGLIQTDEDLVAMEQLENLRQMGIPVEDSDAEHPGIEVESE